MTKIDDPSDNLLGLLPPIRRARGYRLYAEDGRRFLDLFQDGGRSILGSKGRGLGTLLKAGIDKGLAGPFPSVQEAKLRKEVRRSYPDWEEAFFFPREESARDAAEALLGTEQVPVLRAFPDAAKGKDEPVPAPRPGLVLLRLPCPRIFAPGVLLATGLGPRPKGRPLVAPLLLAAAAQSLVEFRGYLEVVGEGTWKKADKRLSGLFFRRGPYLWPLCGREAYGELFRAALAAGVLLSPDYDEPSILPPEFDDGELKPLGKLGPF